MAKREISSWGSVVGLFRSKGEMGIGVRWGLELREEVGRGERREAIAAMGVL